MTGPRKGAHEAFRLFAHQPAVQKDSDVHFRATLRRFRLRGPVARLPPWTIEARKPPEAGTTFAAIIYLAAFVTGAIVMSFEMSGSRHPNPYFGSGIYTWASLISTVLAALCVGYFVWAVAADRYPHASVLGTTVLIGSAYILVLPALSEPLMEFVLAGFDDVKTGSLAALRDPVLSGDLPGHVFAVRHPAAAALGAELGADLRHGLRHLHGGEHRRHPRHHFRSYSLDRHARDHVDARAAGIAAGLLLIALPSRRRGALALAALALACRRRRRVRVPTT